MNARPAEPHPDPALELEVQRRVKEMRAEEIVDFIRSTITQLDTLADRLEVFARDATEGKDSQGARADDATGGG